MHNKNKRSGLQVMLELIQLVKPLMGYILFAILMGSIGHLSAIFIMINGGYGILHILGVSVKISFSLIIAVIAVCALLRGVLRYVEQACNHFIAFKILAIIRHKVFTVLRKLAPAKLEGKEKGNLISIITSDVELLEVFYAHTISPIAIAILTSIVMVIFIGGVHIWFGVIALLGYLLVGVVVPIRNGRIGKEKGENFREEFGKLNTIVLDNLRGMEEIKQYNQGQNRLSIMEEKTKDLEKLQKRLKILENKQRGLTESIITMMGAVTLVIGAYLVSQNKVEGYQVIIGVIAIMSSFGPTIALSNLSNNLNQTLASGNRVLNLLEEKPLLEEVTSENEFRNGNIIGDNISFAYDLENREQILKNYNITIRKGSITGILGKSGSGKSTLLKLFMRFYDPNKGEIRYHNQPLKQINTKSLRKHIAYVTQETFLFHDTIENNIKVAKENASKDEVIEAAQKASIHEFIQSLPKGYETMVSELGESLSGGEIQRIGLARAFLHNSEVIFLDEPTSNLDSLNESVVLKALNEEKENKTIVLVSHRESTMNISDKVIRVEGIYG